MKTHSSVLAWRIPGTGEPGGLPSTGSHRVGHDRSYLAAATACGCADSKHLQHGRGFFWTALNRTVSSYITCIYLCGCASSRGIFSCSMKTLKLCHVGSSSLNTDRTQAPHIGSAESYPLGHQGSPQTVSSSAQAPSLFLPISVSQEPGLPWTFFNCMLNE